MAKVTVCAGSPTRPVTICTALPSELVNIRMSLVSIAVGLFTVIDDPSAARLQVTGSKRLSV